MSRYKKERWKKWRWVIWFVVASFILTIFAVWGGGGKQMGGGSTQNAWVAKVEDTSISPQSFYFLYRNQERQMKEQYGDNYDAVKLQMGSRVVNQMIQTAIAAQEAKKLGFRVSSSELSDYILNMKDSEGNYLFRDKDGRFYGTKIYRRTLQGNNISPAKFEALQKRDILSKKFRDFVKSSIYVSDREAKKEYKRKYERVKLDYILFDLRSSEDIEVSSEEVKTYFENNKQNYKTGEQRRASLVVFKAKDFTDEVKVTEKEIKQYYDKNRKTKYTKKEKRRVRHILLKTSEKKSESDTKKKAEDILKKAKETDNFAALAKEYSEGPSASRGGDLGYFSKGKMVKSFEEVVFNMKPGEIRGPIKTRFGFHIVKLEDVKEGGLIPLKRVKGKIRKKLKLQKARKVTLDKAKKFKTKLKKESGQDFKALAQKKGREITDSGFVESGGKIESLEKSGTLVDSLYTLKKGETTDALQVKNDAVVAKLEEIKDPHIPELESVKEQVKKDARKQKNIRLKKKNSKKALNIAKETNSLKKAAEEFNLEIRSPGFINRQTRLKDLGVQKKLFKMSFSKEPGSFGRYTVPNKGLMIFHTTEKKTFDPERFKKEKESLKRTIRSRQFTELYQGIISNLMEEYSISKNQRIIKRVQGEEA